MEGRCFNCLQTLGQESVHGLHPGCFSHWFGVECLHSPFQLTMKTAGNSNDPRAEINSSFFHGKFRKYSAKLGGSSYIIKVRQPSFPDLPAMEFLCNQIAKKLGTRSRGVGVTEILRTLQVASSVSFGTGPTAPSTVASSLARNSRFF
jgi:hypothetical protein